MTELLIEVQHCAQHFSGRHPDTNAVRRCSSSSERHEVQHHGHKGMQIAYGVSRHKLLKVSYLQLWKVTPEKLTLYCTRICNIATKVLDVGLLLGNQLDT
jgi:uncharacterized protein YaeQ